ncbi:MAG: nicotinamide-nucleotide amidohydrolase family protein [Treponema sp.]|nr:nicotinamide-nucleotide amidohydrolase family protein [Treponema sp.]
MQTPELNEIHSLYRQFTLSLLSENLTITTMESCTSGFLASLITDTEGSSACFKGGCITYSNEAKIKNGVSAEVIKNYGVYSVETAVEMARAVLKMYPSDIGIGITGTFGNIDPNNDDSVPGKVYIAVSIKGKILSEELCLPKNISRFESKLCVAKAVYQLINTEMAV